MSRHTLTFRWTYIILPTAILVLSIAITAYFYPQLPNEVAYHFASGLPDKWMGRGATISWMLAPQLFLSLLAGAIVWGTIKRNAGAELGKGLLLMGNMIALPQIIISFAMLDIFSYNSYQFHIMPLWVFALIVMIGDGTVLGVFFTRALWQTWRPPDATRQTSKERQ